MLLGKGRGGPRNRTEARWRIIVALCVGLMALGLYTATLAPGLTWANDSSDGGDLAIAADGLGIAHPPGYPTYVLLAHPWTRLPFGELATRTNLFSAACAAGAAAALAWAVARARGGWIAAVAAGIALACAPLHWSQAIVTEVHALHNLFGALLLALAVNGEARRDDGLSPGNYLAAATGLVWGLSLGNSPTAAFYLPLILVALSPARRSAVLAASGLVAGLSVYVLLPVRAFAEPAANWGNPRTIARFFWVVSAAPYRAYAFAYPLSDVPARLLSMAQLLVRQFGLVGLSMASAGIASSRTRDRRLLLATGIASALSIAFSIGYDTTDSYLYLAPVLVFLGFWLGTGIAWGIRVARARARTLAYAIGMGTAAVLALTVMLRAPAMDLSGDRGPDDFRARVLDSAPERALILSQRDSYTFALWYYLYATSARPDVAVIDAGLLGLDWYNDQVAAEVPRFTSLADLGSDDLERLAAAAEELGRPVCVIGGDGPVVTCAGRW